MPVLNMYHPRYATETMRKVYLIVVLALTGGLAGLVLWYQHVGAPNQTVATLIPGSTVRREQTVTFAVVGDNEGDNPDYRDLIKQIAADRNVQFLLHVGDTTNRGGVPNWQPSKPSIPSSASLFPSTPSPATTTSKTIATAKHSKLPLARSPAASISRTSTSSSWIMPTEKLVSRLMSWRGWSAI